MNIIYEIEYGSRAYGTWTEGSDLDIRGIFLPTVDEMLLDSLGTERVKEVRKNEEDPRGKYTSIEKLYFPLHKFISLALKANPSVLEWMFVDPKNIIDMSEEGSAVVSMRQRFLSKDVYHRFRGYAHKEYTNLTKLTGHTGDKRKKQILEHGYSPKSAMNCIRLLRQGAELLRDGVITMPDPTAKQLVEIKTGKYRKKQIDEMFVEGLNDIEDALRKTNLPDEPARRFIEREYISIMNGDLS